MRCHFKGCQKCKDKHIANSYSVYLANTVYKQILGRDRDWLAAANTKMFAAIFFVYYCQKFVM